MKNFNYWVIIGWLFYILIYVISIFIIIVGIHLITNDISMFIGIAFILEGIYFWIKNKGLLINE